MADVLNEASTDLAITPETAATGEDDVRARHEANRLAWNEGAVRYTDEIEETIAFLAAGKIQPAPGRARANLGDLRAWCRTAIHLQCASGRDTLSLWNEGVAQVVGVDISDVHIANARRISAGAGRAGGVVSLRPPRYAPRASTARPTWSTPAAGRCAGCTTWTAGPR